MFRVIYEQIMITGQPEVNDVISIISKRKTAETETEDKQRILFFYALLLLFSDNWTIF